MTDGFNEENSLTTIAFLGVAHIHITGFVRMLTARPGVRAGGVFDADPKRRAHWARASGGREAMTVDDALADADAVVITSQTDAHRALVDVVAQAGKPLFVEKPLGMNAADAYAMADAIEKAGVVFQTGYFHRSDPMHRRIKQIIDAGGLGRVTKAYGSNCHGGALGNWFKAKPDAPHEDWHWMTEPARSGVGAFGDLGTHALDVLLWWLGDVTSATAQIDSVTNTYGCDESGQGLMRFKSGATATLTAGWADRADPVRYLVSGTDGYAAVINNQLFVSRDGKFDATKPETDLPPAAPHAFELFLDTVSGHEPAVPLVTAREAAYRSAVMAAMYEGAKTDTWVKPANVFALGSLSRVPTGEG